MRVYICYMYTFTIIIVYCIILDFLVYYYACNYAVTLWSIIFEWGRGKGQRKGIGELEERGGVIIREDRVTRCFSSFVWYTRYFAVIRTQATHDWTIKPSFQKRHMLTLWRILKMSQLIFRSRNCLVLFFFAGTSAAILTTHALYHRGL